MADSTGSFRASFVLSLKDDLSAGLRKIIADVKALRRAAQDLGFKPLEGAGSIVNRVDRDVRQLNTDLGATARQAEAASAAVRRMGAAELGRARANAVPFQPVVRMRGAGSPQTAFIPSTGALVPYAGGGGRGGGGGGLVPFDAPFEERGPIPLNYRRPLGSRIGDGLRGAGQRFNAAREHIGGMEGALAGISLMEPIREAAEFDNVLTHIAITSGATADTVRGKVAEMAETYRAMALATRQSSHDVAESAQFLITTGIGEEMTNKLLPIIAKAATAYNTPMRDAVQGAFSMHEELKIAPEQMQGALSATALAAKQGHFSFADFSSFLPSIAAQAGQSGIKGREGLNSLLAALETSRRGAGTSGQAATNLQDFLGYINAPIGTKSFQKAGINLPGLKLAAEKAGQNPIEAVIEAVRRRTQGMSDARKGTFLGTIFHNQEARIFAQTMLAELQYYEDTKKKISEAGDQTIDEDFAKAQNLHTKLAVLVENSHQLTQRLGDGFSWVVPVGVALTGGLLTGLGWMDHNMPGVSKAVFGLVGGMLGLVAVMGVLGVVSGPVRAGWTLLKPVFSALLSPVRLLWRALLANPITGVAVLMIAAAIDIGRHWDRFRRDFYRIWGGALQVMQGFQQFVTGVFEGNLQSAVAGLSKIWTGLKQAWTDTWGAGHFMEKLFGDFAEFIDTWTGGLATSLGKGITAAFNGAKSFIQQAIKEWQDILNQWQPSLPNLRADPSTAHPAPDGAPLTGNALRGRNPAQVNEPDLRHPTAYRLRQPGAALLPASGPLGVIRIELDDRSTRVTTRSDHPNIDLRAPDRGRMLGRA